MKIIDKIFSIRNVQIADVAGFVKYQKVITICFIKLRFTKYKNNSGTNKLFIGNNEVNHFRQIVKYGEIKINGINNIIKLPDTDNLKCRLEINGENNKIEICDVKRPSYVWCAFEKYKSNRELYIGKSELIGNIHCRIIDDNRKIIIGDNCLFSYGIYIWTTDSHAIYDIKTNERINYDKGIIIGDNVWIGRNVSINKGAVIPKGCVVGANSFVNKEFSDENCIIAGIPAKIVKRNIRWDYNEDKNSTQFVVKNK